MCCFSMMFPTSTKQFLIKYENAAFSKLQVNPIKPLTFWSQETFSLALTLMKVLLPPLKKQNLFLGKIHQETCHGRICVEFTEEIGRFIFLFFKNLFYLVC